MVHSIIVVESGSLGYSQPTIWKPRSLSLWEITWEIKPRYLNHLKRIARRCPRASNYEHSVEPGGRLSGRLSACQLVYAHSKCSPLERGNPCNVQFWITYEIRLTWKSTKQHHNLCWWQHWGYLSLMWCFGEYVSWQLGSWLCLFIVSPASPITVEKISSCSCIVYPSCEGTCGATWILSTHAGQYPSSSLQVFFLVSWFLS